MLNTYLKKKFEDHDLYPSLVARKIDTSRSNVTVWLSGSSTPSMRFCVRIATLIALKEHVSRADILDEMAIAMSKSRTQSSEAVSEWVKASELFWKGEGVEPKILVLHGKQGCGKSTWLKSLCVDGFSDTLWHNETPFNLQSLGMSLMEIGYYNSMAGRSKGMMLKILSDEKFITKVPYEGLREFKRNWSIAFTFRSLYEIPSSILESDAFFVVDFADIKGSVND